MPSATPAHESAPALAVKALLCPDEGFVAAELAERAGIGQSTARKALAALEAAGSARRVENGTGQAATWYSAAVPEPEPAEQRHGVPHAPAQGGEPRKQREAAQAQASGQPTQAGGETVGEATTPAEGQDQAAVPTAVSGRTRGSSVKGLTAPRVREGRLGHGELGVIVLEAFALNPGVAFTAPRLAKLTGRSSGAITNQLVKLSGDGALNQVIETPATYADARTPQAA